MFKKLYIVLFLSTLIACDKKNPKPSSGEYAKGDVVAGIKGDTPIDSVFSICNKNGLQIKRIQDFTYNVPLSPDKFDSISAYLNTKAYVDSVYWKAKVEYNYVWKQPVYSIWFYNMDGANQADWLRTMKELNLTDLGDTFKQVYLGVPEGTELYWVDRLSKHSMIRWAELNHKGQILLD